MNNFNVRIIKVDLEYAYNLDSNAEMTKINELTTQGWKIQASHVTATERGVPQAAVIILIRNSNLNVME